MARMDWTRIFVAAPGLRPTASDAFIPIKPTPSAAPRAASPTCMLPANSAIMGMTDIYLPFFGFCPAAAIEHGPAGRNRWLSQCAVSGVPSLVLADQHGEDCGQQHEDQRLHQAHEQFQKIKRDGQQPTK